MIYLYDCNTSIRFSDSERNVYIGGLDDSPKDFELAEQYILDMIDYGGKVQYWLMDNGFPHNFRIITNNSNKYTNLVSENKIIKA